MIRLRVELCPYGDTTKPREIGHMVVENITPDADGPSDYRVQWSDDQKTTQDIIVRRHRREDGVWALVRKALEKVP